MFQQFKHRISKDRSEFPLSQTFKQEHHMHKNLLRNKVKHLRKCQLILIYRTQAGQQAADKVAEKQAVILLVKSESTLFLQAKITNSSSEWGNCNLPLRHRPKDLPRPFQCKWTRLSQNFRHPGGGVQKKRSVEVKSNAQLKEKYPQKAGYQRCACAE